MLDKIVLKMLPANEQRIYQQLRTLPDSEKRVLHKLLKDTDKNGVALYSQESLEILSLIWKGYIAKNPSYHGMNYSYFVLPKNPCLMNALRQYTQRSKRVD
jgi:hypothetical protein